MARHCVIEQFNGTCTAAPESFFTNQNVGKHISAILKAGKTSLLNGSYFDFGESYYNALMPPNGFVNVKKEIQIPRPPIPPAIFSSTSLNETKGKWIDGSEHFSWDGSTVASYNPDTKMFRCIACHTVGYLSRIAEHYLGTHANAKVFQCPQCPYSSAWSRCVRMHMSKHHNLQNAPTYLWKGQPLLDEIFRILQHLKNSVEEDNEKALDRADKRYACPKCPYATDRRDLYTRHENIHREDKPFHCYVCFKMFNRADHVKKHFLRIHKEHSYDTNLIRRFPPKNSNPVGSSWPVNGMSWFEAPKKNHPTNRTFAPTVNNDNVTPKPINGISKALKNSKKGTKLYACSYCPWRGVDNWCLRRHLNTHIKPFPCPLCDYKAARSERLATHVLKLHSQRACHRCCLLVGEDEDLEKHMLEKHSSNGSAKKTRCSCCNKTVHVKEEPQSSSFLDLTEAELHQKSNMIPFFPVLSNGASAGPPNFIPLGQSALPSTEQSHEKHTCMETEKVDNSRKIEETFCRLCGCEFLDEFSLRTHIRLLHQFAPPKPAQNSNSLPQPTKHTFSCTICCYTSLNQSTIMEHMRLHSGQLLNCRAGDGCNYHTPYDSFLQNHIKSEHSDDHIIRCPHCGFRCSTKQAFLQHCSEDHHSTMCHLCEIIQSKYFAKIEENNIAAFISNNNNNNQISSLAKVGLKNDDRKIDNIVYAEQFKRSRKQSTPRKIVKNGILEEYPKCSEVKSISLRLLRKLENKLRKQMNLYCKTCLKRVNYYHRGGLALHTYWYHQRKRQNCKNCCKSLRHRYQLLLHNSGRCSKDL